MRSIYPVSSQEINDILLSHYENLIYILGYKNNNVLYSGVYTILDNVVNNTTIEDKQQLINILKYDYIYKKNSKSI